MYKVLWCLRRKPGIAFEQFRDHYETHHVPLGKRYFGHLMLDYTRNYNRCRATGAAPSWPTLDYDCVTEWVMKDEAAFEESLRLLAHPDIQPVFHADEEHFLDRESILLLRCSVAGGPYAP